MNWILLLLLSAIWGGAFTLNKFALEAYSPEFLVAGRLLIASIILLGFVLIIFRKIEFDFLNWRYYIFMSIVGIVAPFLLISHGQIGIDSSLAGILMSTMPISTLILSHFFLDDEIMTNKKLIGFMIAFIGIVILIMPDKNIVENNFIDGVYSELMVIGGAVLYSFAAVYGKRFKITNPLNASTGVILYSAIIICIYIMFNSNLIPVSYSSLNHITAVIILGVFCTAIATIIYFQILQSSGATFISIMNYLIPIWAILFGVIFFEEDVSWNYFIGLIIIVFGIQLSQSKGNSRKITT
ncbi:MAG: DMT family transporter [Gammaproteobacteria bacterium]|nr:DMT family transporter [Gammaproteobacteria bacterium]MBT4462632.1 DMT family transporter [Gammaproteobacteria bacterium]MBT5116621.1 DMT family transporter [Gammaproteobacteria bacterium]MBT5761752.1 DMT family transporter [Gammaproteobacteria bacterium]MBT6331270.1 DMT family transporter [Gammaproteobacteria bacterium]